MALMHLLVLLTLPLVYSQWRSTTSYITRRYDIEYNPYLNTTDSINLIVEQHKKYLKFIQNEHSTSFSIDSTESNGILHLLPEGVYEGNAPEHTVLFGKGVMTERYETTILQYGEVVQDGDANSKASYTRAEK